MHCPMTLDAVAARKHVLVEKPIALTVADATRMIEAAEARGVKLYVAESLFVDWEKARARQREG